MAKLFISLLVFSVVQVAGACDLKTGVNFTQVSCLSGSLLVTKEKQLNTYSLFLPQNLVVELFTKPSLKLDKFKVNPGLRAKTQLTQKDIQLFTEIAKKLQGDDKKVIEDFFMSLPLGEDLKNLERASSVSRTNRSYRSICKYIGKRKAGHYIANGKKRKKVERVGFKSNGCKGRCGRQCNGSSRYTQECLNHDACAYAIGENLGECSSEFWEASDGFFNAPICKKKPK